jgi:hypothetical protein
MVSQSFMTLTLRWPEKFILSNLSVSYIWEDCCYKDSSDLSLLIFYDCQDHDMIVWQYSLTTIIWSVHSLDLECFETHATCLNRYSYVIKILTVGQLDIERDFKEIPIEHAKWSELSHDQSHNLSWVNTSSEWGCSLWFSWALSCRCQDITIGRPWLCPFPSIAFIHQWSCCFFLYNCRYGQSQ